MDTIIDDWLSADAWNCKVSPHRTQLHSGQTSEPNCLIHDDRTTTSSPKLPASRRRNAPEGSQALLPTSPATTKHNRQWKDISHKPPFANDQSRGFVSSGYTNELLYTSNNETRTREHDTFEKKYRPKMDMPTNYQWPKTLPPKQLYGYRHKTAYYRLLRTIIILILIAVAIYSLVILFGVQKSSVVYNSCESTSASWFESRFFINVIAKTNLSFTQAKLLDLAWDTFIGQGLRVLHAWWLYQVATHVVTCLLESSALPYDVQLDMLFRTDSLSSLMAALKLIYQKNRTKGRYYFVWLVYAIGYVLAFPTLWAASTGYANPSITAYNLSDQAYVPKGSGDLKLCWLQNDFRLGGYIDTVVLGPSFYSSFYFHRDIVPRLDTQWDDSVASDDFRDILYYAKTKHSLQNYFNASNFSSTSPTPKQKPINGTASWRAPEINVTEEWDGLLFFEANNSTQQWSSPGLVQVLEGFQFSRFGPYNDAVYRRSGYSQGSGILPYNSTLQYRNISIHLSAPFVEFGIGDTDCTWWNSTTGECPCYRGKPLGSDWAIGREFVRIGAQGYVWGFSSFILIISLILETVWVIGIGTARHILDLAEAMNRDLGLHTSTYTDIELRDALKNCPPVGYQLGNTDGVKHIGLVTIHHGDDWKEKIDMNFDDTYG
ncbi:hypothetical protein F5Y19DRAFT_471116 [Xylariaceae sp. FL1651]|nr:hypothetical protein F5Y19DRAFT_471116 [Xylariaceae sp. FL1651]